MSNTMKKFVISALLFSLIGGGAEEGFCTRLSD